MSLFHKTFLTSTFRDNELLNASMLRPNNSRSGNVHDRRFTHERRTYQGLINIQEIHHEKPTLEAREVTKLLRSDTTSSNDDFPSYAQSIKLIFTRSTTQPVNNETQDLYHKRSTLSKFIHEGRPTTTKRLSLLFEPSDETIRRLYGIPGEKNLSVLFDVRIDKSLQFQVNWLNIALDTSVRARPKNSSQNYEFFIPSITLTLIYLYKTFYNFNMSTPPNIPETLMGGTEQDSFSKSKEKFQQQLQDIFQTILKLTGPDHFDQLCQWMEYKQYLTIDEFYESSYNDPDKFDTKGPATEYKWKGKMNHLSPIVVQKLKCLVKWTTHEDRPYELHDDFLATLTRERYLKFRHMDTVSFLASSPSHHEPHKHQVKKGPQRKAFFSQQEEISDDNEYANAEEQFSTDPEPEEHSPYSVYQSFFHPKMPQKSFLPPNIWETPPESTKQMIIEHNKKVKINNPTPYPSGSKTKPNPTLGKPTPAPQ